MQTPERAPRLPLSGLLALAAAGFATVLNEALPAGLLPQIADGLGVTQAMAGQLVTVYAVGSLAAAIPLVVATRGWRRRPLLLGALAGFMVVNSVVALTGHIAVALVARFFAGVFAGLVWALLAGYAARMVRPDQGGRAIAVAMAGIPVALSLGIPAGTWLGAALGWRAAFWGVSIVALLLLGWVRWRVPDFAGEPAGQRRGLRAVMTLPGLRPVLIVMLAAVLAHNILYTYIAPVLVRSGLAAQVDRVLLVYGLSSVAGLWLTSLLIDRRMRGLALASLGGFGLASLALGLLGAQPAAVWLGVALWGLSFGGAPALYQTASAKTAGDAADVAQSMLVTGWNIGIAGGGVVGGALLDAAGAGALPWSAVLLLAAALVLAWTGAHGFPRAPRQRALATAL